MHDYSDVLCIDCQRSYAVIKGEFDQQEDWNQKNLPLPTQVNRLTVHSIVFGGVRATVFLREMAKR